MCPPDPQRAHHRQMQRIHLTPCAKLPWYKRMPPWLAVLAWRQRRPSFLHCVITCRQQRLPTSRSKRRLAWGCLGGWPLERQRRPDGWTKTPRANKGAAAKTMPGSLVCFWYGCLEDVGIAGFVRGVLRHCVQLRHCCTPLHACLSAAAFAFMQQQAAARKAIPSMLRP